MTTSCAASHSDVTAALMEKVTTAAALVVAIENAGKAVVTALTQSGGKGLGVGVHVTKLPEAPATFKTIRGPFENSPAKRFANNSLAPPPGTGRQIGGNECCFDDGFGVAGRDNGLNRNNSRPNHTPGLKLDGGHDVGWRTQQLLQFFDG